MIVYTIILIAAAIIIVALAILAYIAIQDSNRQARYFEMARQDLKTAYADKEALKAENGKLQQDNVFQQTIIDGLSRERDELKARDADLSEALEATRRLYNNLLRERQELVARNTALVEAMEAKPTQPKRTVRKNSIARIDISEGEPL